MPRRLTLALLILAATGLAACKHVYAGGDVGRLRAAPATDAPSLNRS